MSEDKNCKIKITGGLAFEGEISIAVAHQIVGIAIGGPTQDSGQLPPPSTLHPGLTIKKFIALKRPTTDVEKIACLAFYLTNNQSTPKFKSAELEAAVTDAAMEISNLPRAIDNATRQSKYLAKAGEGTKQITILGENIVEALPDRAAVTAILSEKPISRRKRVTRKKKP